MDRTGLSLPAFMTNAWHGPAVFPSAFSRSPPFRFRRPCDDAAHSTFTRECREDRTRRQDSRVFYNAQTEVKDELEGWEVEVSLQDGRPAAPSRRERQRRAASRCRHQTNDPSYVTARPVEALPTKVATVGPYVSTLIPTGALAFSL